jgi:hypothetical protein
MKTRFLEHRCVAHRFIAQALLATVFVFASTTPTLLQNCAWGRSVAPSDPIVGEWDVTYGAPAVVTMALTGGVYTETAKTPIELTGGSSCSLPPGTVIATFSQIGPRSYSGRHGLWFQSNCSFASYASFRLTLSANGLTLTSTLGNGEHELFHKIATIINGFSATDAQDPYSVAERQMLGEIPGRAVVSGSGSPVCALHAAAANQVQNGAGLVVIWTVAPSAAFIHEGSARRLAGAQIVTTYLAGILKRSKSLYLAALQADPVPAQGSGDLDSWWGVEVRSISTTGTLMTFEVAATATTSTTTWGGVPGVSSSASQAMAPKALANLLYYTKNIAVLPGTTTLTTGHAGTPTTTTTFAPPPEPANLAAVVLAGPAGFQSFSCSYCGSFNAADYVAKGLGSPTDAAQLKADGLSRGYLGATRNTTDGYTGYIFVFATSAGALALFTWDTTSSFALAEGVVPGTLSHYSVPGVPGAVGLSYTEAPNVATSKPIPNHAVYLCHSRTVIAVLVGGPDMGEALSIEQAQAALERLKA